MHDAAASMFGQMLKVGLNSLAFNQPAQQQYQLRGTTSMSFGPLMICGGSFYIYYTAFSLPERLQEEADMYIFSSGSCTRRSNVGGGSRVFGTHEPVAVWMRDGELQGPPQSDSPRNWLIFLWLI